MVELHHQEKEGHEVSYYTDVDVRRLKNGKWQAYCYFKDADGKRKQKTKVMESALKRDAKPEAQGCQGFQA